MRLDALFRPGSVAIIGASEKPTVGRRMVASLDRIGFAGAVYPVNPAYPSVLGHACYGTLDELPEAPDVALFCVGHARVLDAVIAAAARGVRGAVIYDGGFAEQGEEGRNLQDRIAAICREAGIALCGPNCMGVLNPHHPSTIYLGELRDPAGLAGNVGLVSQSGGVCISLLSDLRRFGFSHVASSGNEAVLAAADYLEYLVEDPHTQAIGVFIETIRQEERFVAALDRAAALGKPVIALKVGRGERARRAIPSHTGDDAGDPGAAAALLRAHRAIEVADLIEMTEALAACQGAPRPAGRRIGVVMSSGGLAEVILDIADADDLLLPPLSAAQRGDIVARIGPITGDGNPLDAWGSGGFVGNLPQALSLLDASPGHDIVVFCRDNAEDQAFDSPQLVEKYLDLLVAAAANSRKPHYLLHTRPGIMDRAVVERLRAAGIAVVGGLREGLGAIDRLARLAGRANS